MKSTPIMFTSPMVRAIIEGRKTQTRRVVKTRQCGEIVSATEHAAMLGESRHSFWNFDVQHSKGLIVEHGVRCPYGGPGDQLWVKEAYCSAVDPGTSKITVKLLYAATDECEFLDDGDGYPVENKDGSYRSPWKSPLFMPRWASRLTLEIVAVRVERLQEISEEDARAEGVLVLRDGRPCDPRTGFSVGWDKINGKRAPWSSNPWVWVIEFRKVEQYAAQRSAGQ